MPTRKVVKSSDVKSSDDHEGYQTSMGRSRSHDWTYFKEVKEVHTCQKKNQYWFETIPNGHGLKQSQNSLVQVETVTNRNDNEIFCSSPKMV